jgi:hypothetical protein
MILPDKVYDVLKWIVILFLPALGALYAGLSDIWGLPYADQIPGTLHYIQVFLGVILGITTYQYNKSQSQIDELDYVGDVEEDYEMEDEHDA